MAIFSNRQNESETEPSRTGEMADLTRDVVALRAELVKLEVLETAETWINRILRNGAVVSIVSVGALFMLIAAALGIGDALDHLGWGMLIVGGGVVVAGGVFAWVRPQLVELEDDVAEVKAERLEPPPGHQAQASQH